MNLKISQRITNPTRKRGYYVLHRQNVLFPCLRVGLVLFAIALTSPLFAADDPPPAGPIVAHPAAIEFRQHRQVQSLQLLGSTADGYSLDLRTPAQLTIADPKIAVIDDKGLIRPLASGQTNLTAVVAGQMLNVPIKVTLPPAKPPQSFRHEVMPVLSKSGCNMGACHGYSLGKNGFKLSLRGADPELDYASISKEFFGRRVNLGVPEASLVVAKARGDMPHEGGVRFKKGSLANDILVSWVKQGTPSDLADPNRVIGIKLIPDKLVLRPGQKHRLQLIATYTDGTTADVTRMGIFTANNNQYADVDVEGMVLAGDSGETAIMARYERTFAATGVIVLGTESNFTPSPVPENLVDKPIVEKLNRLKIVPSALAGDEEFLRRVYIDLIGVQPKPEEIKAFVANADPQKREKTVDLLLERPEFVDHWSLKWGDLLQNSRNAVSSPGVFLFREFLRNSVSSNMPLDEFCRKILTARGGAADDPASAFFAVSKDTNETVERTTQVFCGVRMLCARCHTHPLENWTQADYYGVGSFFSQVSVRPDPRLPGIGNAKMVQVNLAGGFATNPRSGQAQTPKFLGGPVPELAANSDRREAYAKWLTAPENPFFARGIVNRIWSYFYHRGIIEPVDDIRSTNPPINPALLEALTKDFIEHKFDVRHLMRRIVTSQTYQRTSIPTPSNKSDQLNFSHSIPRRVPAEALLDCLVQASGVPENIGGAPGGFRAAQLPDANVTSDFLSLFGKPQRMEACECERDNTSNMLQALHFLNGNSILGRVQNPAARPALLFAQKLPDDQLVTELYQWSIARSPSAAELKLGIEFLGSYGDKKNEAAQDLMWALLNSKDFLLVH
jgi:hypothetical protein